jgi:hypothetical protein
LYAPRTYRLVAFWQELVWEREPAVGKKFGVVLIGLGVFVLALALLSRFYVYDRLAVVPLDQDTVSVSEGPGATIFDIATQEEITLDLESVRKVVGDVEASEQASEELDRDIAIWETSVITDEPGAAVDDDNPPRSGTHDRVAFDRHTGEAIDCCDNYLASTADLETGQEDRDTERPITGQYYKLPFNTQKQTYQFWDGALKDSTDLQYKATEDIDGLTVYRFEQVIEPTDVADINAPASIFGIDEEGDIQLDRIYANTRTLWVEPETGVIIRGQEAQDVVAEYQGQEVATLTNVVIGYNEATIQDNVETYSDLSSQLKIIRVWLPMLGGALGVLLILIGLFLTGRDSSRRRGVRSA